MELTPAAAVFLVTASMFVGGVFIFAIMSLGLNVRIKEARAGMTCFACGGAAHRHVVQYEEPSRELPVVNYELPARGYGIHEDAVLAIGGEEAAARFRELQMKRMERDLAPWVALTETEKTKEAEKIT